MKLRSLIIFSFSLLLLFCLNVPGQATTKSGTSIESEGAEMRHDDIWVTTTETSSMTVWQIHGLTLSNLDSSATAETNVTYYFPHTLENMGNGTSLFTMSLTNITPEGWSANIVNDDNNNSIHEITEITLRGTSTQCALAEEATFNFFAALTASREAANGSVSLTTTDEVADGGFYFGGNGILYGGVDVEIALDKLSAVSTAGALADLEIERVDSTGKIVLSWSGGNADIHYVENNYSHSFAGSSIEAANVSSPYTAEVTAGNGNIRYYRVARAGSGILSTAETAAKFDITFPVDFKLFSLPLFFTSEAKSSLNSLIGSQLTGGSFSALSDRAYSFQGSTWLQAYLKSGVGWQGSLTKLTGDKAAWMYVVPGHSPKCVSFVGKVPTYESVAINLVNGFNFVGSVYPVAVDLDDSGLASVLTPGSFSTLADRVYSFQNGTWLQAYLKTGVGFVGSLTSLSPGQGYWIYKQGAAASWTYPRPY